MQCVNIVEVKNDWPPSNMVVGQRFVHRRSSCGNHLFLVNGKWENIFDGHEKLMYRWRDIVFGQHFNLLKTAYVKNHREASKVRMETFKMKWAFPHYLKDGGRKMINEKQKEVLELIQKAFVIPATLEIKDAFVIVVINGKSYTTEFHLCDLVTMIEESNIEPTKIAKVLLGIVSRTQIKSGYETIVAKEEKMYTVEEIKAYASSWLKAGLSTDGKDSIPENNRLSAVIHYIDADDRDNIDNFLARRKEQIKEGGN